MYRSRSKRKRGSPRMQCMREDCIVISYCTVECPPSLSVKSEGGRSIRAYNCARAERLSGAVWYRS